MISLTSEKTGSICIDVTSIESIDDTVPVLKALLMWMGFAMHTIDDLFDDELKELKNE